MASKFLAAPLSPDLNQDSGRVLTNNSLFLSHSDWRLFLSDRNKKHMTTPNVKPFSALHTALLQCAEKVSDDDILVADDAMLLEHFVDVLRELNGEEVAEAVRNLYLATLLFNCA